MLPYWLLFLMFAVGALQTRGSLTPRAEWFGGSGSPYPGARSVGTSSSPLLFAAVTFTAFLIGFRYQVGADWIPYELTFIDISYLDFWTALSYSDISYGLLNWLAHAAGLEIWIVNLVCAALFCFGLIRFAKAQPNPWLAIVVAVPYFVIGVGMGYTRQAVAIAFTMCALVSISRNSFLKFLMWMALAATFHRTAVVLVPIVAVSYARSRFQSIVLGLIAALIGYYVLLAGATANRYSAGYIDAVYEAQGAGVRLAMNVLPAFLLLANLDKFNLNPTERSVWRNLSLVAIVMFGVYFLISSSVIVDRLGLYLIPVQLFVLSRLPLAMGKPGQPSAGVLLLVLGYSALVQFVWLNFANHAGYWLPYKVYPFFW